MNGSPFVKVGQFNRDAGSVWPCRWSLLVGIYSVEKLYQKCYEVLEEI
jgi:hypothetical protein